MAEPRPAREARPPSVRPGPVARLRHAGIGVVPVQRKEDPEDP
jgi:hypothetical protein